jgi:hypothetical protein
MAEYLLAVLFGLFVGFVLAIMPDWVVVVRGKDDGLLMVEYKKQLYRLEKEQR